MTSKEQLIADWVLSVSPQHENVHSNVICFRSAMEQKLIIVTSGFQKLLFMMGYSLTIIIF